MKPGENSAGLLTIAVLAIVLGTLAVALRLYTRRVVLNQIGLDDYLAIVSWVCLMALAANNFMNVFTGLGSRMKQIPANTLESFSFYLWLGLVIYNVCLLFTKLTLFFQFYRIIQTTTLRAQKMVYIGIMSIIGAWQIGQVFVQIFACTPVQASWEMNIHGNCQTINNTRIMNSVANIVTDFIILLLPLPVIWRLNLPKNQKLALTGVFCLGFLTCIISILRLTITPLTITDPALQTANSVTFSTAEVLSGVIIAAVSTMRPLIGRYVPGLRTKASSSGASYRLQHYGGASRGASGLASVGKSTYPSSSSRRSHLMPYSTRQINGGGWLDLSDSERSNHEGLRSPDLQSPDLQSPEPARLGTGITVTKEWEVHA